MKKNSISFIIPAYNCSKTVEQSVRSIINDNIAADDEIVIVNDYSSDDTGKVLSKIKKTHKKYNIVIFNHPYNKGGAAARNTAVEIAKNKLIFCLDSDNILEKGSIKKLKELLLLTKSDIAAFQKIAYFKSSPKSITHYWVFPDKENLDFAYYLSHHKNPGASGNYLFTKKSWINSGGYPEGAGALDAWGFGLRQVANGAKVAILPNSQYFHRYGYESYWVRDSKKYNNSLKALQIMIPFIHLLKDKDINYIFSRRNRYTWFDKLDSRPLRLK